MNHSVDQAAKRILETNRVAVFIVAYNASKHIDSVLNRIPSWVSEKLAEVFLIDDSSCDQTAEIAAQFDWPNQYAPLKIFKTPFNQGYGGNQKIGYNYAIQSGFDIVILLHGDGQYAPEALPAILASYADGVDAVFGSRFIKMGDALKGGMPLYKFVGNRILTKIQNIAMGSRLSEWHSGYRSYRTSLLRGIPFISNSSDFEFDSEIIIQTLGSGYKITEVPIPTYYGDEICHVNGIQYAWRCFLNALQYRAMQLELFYDPKFDLKRQGINEDYLYTRKTAKTTLHHYIRNLKIPGASKVLDFGGGDGRAVSSDLVNRGLDVTVLDTYANPNGSIGKQVQFDLDSDWHKKIDQKFDIVLALDVIEHLIDPEIGVAKIASAMNPGAVLYASTGNVAFFLLRFMLLLGYFNYGRKGILDKTHKRLFTVSSFCRLLKQSNFSIESIIGFGPPISDLATSKSRSAGILDQIFYQLAKLRPTFLSYQFLVIAKKRSSIADLLFETTGR
jgi:glycosyltransferase involved in cell wall biosynthesis